DPARVAGLVLASTGPGPLPGAVDHARGIPALAATTMVELGYREYIYQNIRDTFFTPSAAPAQIHWLHEAYWADRPSLHDYFRHMAARQLHDTVAQAPSITQPTLVMIGDGDETVGGTGSHVAQSRFLADTLPNARMHVLAGQRHGYLWEAVEESVAVIRGWLAEVR